MKLTLPSVFLLSSACSAGAFQLPSPQPPATTTSGRADVDRKAFVKAVVATTAATAGASLFGIPGITAVVEPAHARGRATLEKSYERYAPRVVDGIKFYGTDLRKLVERSDWAGIKNALQEPPERKKEDLSKPDAGVAARAKQAGQLSEARVVVAADLLAAAFSDSSISPKTKKMKAAVENLRAAVQGMSSTAKLALGEEKSGGLFGFGGKKPSASELAKQMRDYYVAGGNAFNEYIYAANEDLALQFDRFPFVGA